MDVLRIGQWAAVGLIAAVGVFILVRFLAQRIARFDAMREVRRKLNGTPIVSIAPNAYFLGFNRSWDGQWRGGGVLLLSEEMLYFRLSRRNLDLSIPLGQVEAVRVSREEGRGWRVGSRCLQVEYRGVDGELRNAVWRLRHPERWMGLLRRDIGRNANDREA